MNQDLKQQEKSLMYHKKSPDVFLEAFKQALSYYPELQDTRILIHETHLFGVQHTLRSYPPLTVLHWRKTNWVYPIVINKNKNINISFYDLTLEQQIGFLVHELSHIATYINFSRYDIFLFSIRYAFNKEFVRKIEKETDLQAVSKGAGVYLFLERILESNFRLNNPYPEMEDTYIGHNEIFENLKKYPYLYPQVEIDRCALEIEKNKNKSKLGVLPLHISLSRKIKHSLKTIFGFIPEFIKMFYVITIKKTHLK